jgi:hypothetical protein
MRTSLFSLLLLLPLLDVKPLLLLEWPLVAACTRYLIRSGLGTPGSEASIKQR